jgi:hypothetical protein
MNWRRSDVHLWRMTFKRWSVQGSRTINETHRDKATVHWQRLGHGWWASLIVKHRPTSCPYSKAPNNWQRVVSQGVKTIQQLTPITSSWTKQSDKADGSTDLHLVRLSGAWWPSDFGRSFRRRTLKKTKWAKTQGDIWILYEHQSWACLRLKMGPRTVRPAVGPGKLWNFNLDSSSIVPLLTSWTPWGPTRECYRIECEL